MDQTLYTQLHSVRETLKKVGADGRTPTVCTDAALREMCRLAPKNREELLLVPGLGKTFAEKYGEAFLAVLQRYHAGQVRENVLRPDVRETLKNLETRLVNVNKRNRMLYMPKLPTHYAYDLAMSGKSARAQS